MIFYFTGTGNSKYAASQLAARLNDRLVAIADAMSRDKYAYTLSPSEPIGFVFPTYSWGPAPLMLEFMRHLQLTNYNPDDNYCYMATTCGDDIGESVDIWRKALPSGIKGNAAFSIQMPNNYILLPGFDVDPKKLEQEKIANSDARIEGIANRIIARDEVVDVVTGSFKWVKSRVILPLFKKYAMSDKPFHTDEALCNACQLCVRSCPMHNITADSCGRPVWHHHCAMCLSCIHRCPVRAINYGKITLKKGRYHFKK